MIIGKAKRSRARAGAGRAELPFRSRYACGAALCLAMVATGCGTSGSPSEAPSPGRTDPGAAPNIALFMIDTLRADALGCYGAEYPDTSPEIDALAARGVRFANVFAQCSWTRPSVGSMLTGMYPRRLGIYHETRGILGDAVTTLAEALHAQGYRTFGITANPHMNKSFNFHQGFDAYVDSNTVYEFMKQDGVKKRYDESTLATAADMFDKVLAYDGSHDAERRYVQVTLMEVHEWIRGPRDLTRPEYDGLFPGPVYGRYHSAVRQTSADLGAFIERLRERPGWDDALFIIVSDHGEGLNDYPSVEKSVTHGFLLYESLLHVPFVMYREGWEFAGRVVERPARLMDLMPTVLDAAGLPVPRGLTGVSLMPAVREPGAPLPLPEYFVAETFMRDHDKAAVYGDGWRFYDNTDEQPGTARYELQIAGQPEDGRRTSVLAANRDKAVEMNDFLKAWRTKHPPAAPLAHKQAISDEEKEQLRAIGYVE
jgi:arylsulfatase A-like enzyme